MQSIFQPGKNAPKPTWLRLIGMLCLLLICVASTAEVCHTHSETTSTSKDSRQNVPGPDHCPLCVAMHSALPATANTVPEPVLQVQMVLFKAVELQRLQRWSFELFSRPPPVVSSLA